MNRRFYALGRLKSGQRNKSETAYDEQILRPALMAGEILWYRFEGIKLKLADNTFLTPDYAVLPASGVMELHDVKGSPAIFMEDAKVKMKVAAEAYPFVFKVCFPLPKKLGGGWKVETI